MFPHEVAAENGRTAGNASFAVNQHVPGVCQVVFDELEGCLVKGLQLGVLGVVGLNPEMMLCESVLVNLQCDCLLEVELLFHDCENCSDILLEYALPECILAAKKDTALFEVTKEQWLVVTERHLLVVDKINFGVLLHEFRQRI